MSQLTLEIPADLERVLKNLAAEQKTSVEQIAFERLNALVLRPGSPRALLQSLNELPRLDPVDVEALKASIREGRVPPRDHGIFD